MTDTPSVYQPRIVIDDYERAADVLARQIENRVIRGWPEVDAHTIDQVCQQFARLGIEVRSLDAATCGHAEYVQRAAYSTIHPGYYTGNLPEKSLEHHLSCRALELRPGDVFIDVASEHSALPEIASRLFGVRAYAQDITYPPGLAERHIGGDACAMPVPDGFATKAALTCSLEHFEGDGDTRLFGELSRVLAIGGAVFVVPLYLLPEPSVLTDPRWSAGGDVPFDRGAVVYCADGWGNRHGRFYSPRSLVERILLPNVDAFRFTVFRIVNTEAVDPSVYARFALLAERVGGRLPGSAP